MIGFVCAFSHYVWIGLVQINEEETECWRKESFCLGMPNSSRKNGLIRNCQRYFPQGVNICSFIKKQIHKIIHNDTDSWQCSRYNLNGFFKAEEGKKQVPCSGWLCLIFCCSSDWFNIVKFSSVDTWKWCVQKETIEKLIIPRQHLLILLVFCIKTVKTEALIPTC